MHLLAGEGGEAGEPETLRKELLLARLGTLVGVMAVEVIAFAIMDNHVHLLLRVDRQEAAGWSDEGVLRRWWTLHPLRDGHNRRREAEQDEVAQALADAALVAAHRAKPCCLSGFMKEFKRHAAEAINRLGEASGPAWAGRFKSEAVTDPEQLVATVVYVDPNPSAAGVCDTPQEGRCASLAGRLGEDKPVETPVAATQDAEPAASQNAPGGVDRRAQRPPRRRASGAATRE